MSEKRYNGIRLPGNVFDENLHEKVPPYNVRGGTDETGSHNFTYFDPNKPKNSSKEEMGPDGSFKITAIGKDKAGYTVVNNNEKREYNSGGSGKHSDGHQDKSGEATYRKSIRGDSSSAVGGTKYDQSGKSVENRRGSSAKGTVGSSTADVYIYNDSTSTTITEGDRFGHVKGDTQFSVGGSKYETVGGEYGKNIQGGNFDIQVDTGKARLKVKKEILIESDEKITLKVGSSTITITSGNIVIQSARVDINP